MGYFTNHINMISLSHELLCHIVSFLPLREMLSVAMLCKKLRDAVDMHLQLCKSLDFAEGMVFGYMPASITDEHMHALLKKCPHLEFVYGLHPQKVERRRLRKRAALTVPGILEALCLCPYMKGVETCDLRLMEAILQHLPQLEIIGHFRNRDGTFPPQASQRLKLQPYPRITSLHLTGVEVPELTVMPDLQHLYLQWVRFTRPHPFRVFMAPNLRTFVMRHCMGPPVSLRYLSLVVALSAAPSLIRLELVRVPIPGGLIQRAVEDSWKNGGFRKLNTLVVGGCKNIMESDVGHLMIVASQNLETVALQPSLTKDSLFVSLSFAQCDFSNLKTLHLGYVDDLPLKGEWSNDFLLTLGLADVPDIPAPLTDSGMKVISRLFSNLRTMSISNCPHLMTPDLWAPEGQRAWSYMTDLTFRRCHCLRLPSFALFLALLPAIETVILEDMFREPPKGCSHVGLSAGTGLGMSSAVVSNQEEQVAVHGQQQDIQGQLQDDQNDGNFENDHFDQDLLIVHGRAHDNVEVGQHQEIREFEEQELIEPQQLMVENHGHIDEGAVEGRRLDHGSDLNSQSFNNHEENESDSQDEHHMQVEHEYSLEEFREGGEGSLHNSSAQEREGKKGITHGNNHDAPLCQNSLILNSSDEFQETKANHSLMHVKQCNLIHNNSTDLSQPSTSYSQSHSTAQNRSQGTCKRTLPKRSDESCFKSGYHFHTKDEQLPDLKNNCESQPGPSHCSNTSAVIEKSKPNQSTSDNSLQNRDTYFEESKNDGPKNKTSISKQSSCDRNNNLQDHNLKMHVGTKKKLVADNEKSSDPDAQKPSCSKNHKGNYNEIQPSTSQQPTSQEQSHCNSSSVCPNEFATPSTSHSNYQGPLTRHRKRLLSSCTSNSGFVSQGIQATSEDIRQSLGRHHTSQSSDTSASHNISHTTSQGISHSRESSNQKNREKRRIKQSRKQPVSKRDADVCNKATSTSDPLLEDDPIQILRVVSETLISLSVISCGISDVIIDHCHRLIHVEAQACRILKGVYLRHCPSLVRINISQCPKLETTNLVSGVLSLPTRRGRLVFLEPCSGGYDTLELEKAVFCNATSEHDVLVLHDFSPDKDDRAIYREKVLSWLRLFSRMCRVSVVCAKRKPSQVINKSDNNSENYPWGHFLTKLHGELPDGRYEIMTNNPWLKELWWKHDGSTHKPDSCFPCPESCGYVTLSEFVLLLSEAIAEWKEMGHCIQTKHVGFYIHIIEDGSN